MEISRKRRHSVLNGDSDGQENFTTCSESERSMTHWPYDHPGNRMLKRHCAVDYRNDVSSNRIIPVPSIEQMASFEPQGVSADLDYANQQAANGKDLPSCSFDDDEFSLLNRDQLLNILSQLINNHKYLAPELARMIPRVSPSTAEKQLLALEKELYDSFPRTRDGMDTSSDYAFTRAGKQLRALKSKLLKHLEYFSNPHGYGESRTQQNYPLHSFQFLEIAGSIVRRFPVWQNDSNNREFTADSYTHLARAWKFTICEVAKSDVRMNLLPMNLVSSWFRTLHFYTDLVKGNYGFLEALQDFDSTFSWCPLTLENSMMLNSALTCQYISFDHESLSHRPASSSRSAAMLTSASS